MQALMKEIKYFAKNFQLFLLSFPGILAIFIFAYIPMVGIIIAFKDVDNSKGVGIIGSKWVGFENFKFFFTSQDWLKVTKNTIVMNFSFIIIGLVFAVTFALLLYQLKGRVTRIYQTAMFFPYFLSWVVVSYVLYVFLSFDCGIVNRILVNLGMQPVQWYAEAKYWYFILIAAHLWKGIGYGTIIYYTGLMGIDESYYEAAAIDGASKLQQIFKISIPLLSPLIILLTVMNIGHIIRSDFGLFYFLTNDSTALYSVTDVIDTYVYRSLRSIGSAGMASAVGLYQSVVGFLLVLATNFVIKKINEESAIF